MPQPPAPQPYTTVAREATDEYIVQKSRFLGHCAPVESEAEALRFLAGMRQRYKDASHNCYAYVVGLNAGVMRYSDDGEPGGTAGLPMMEVLRQRGVVNCCVVVTRYFGGVLLGAGGLVRAYSRATVLALDAARVVTMHPTLRFLADVPYPLWDKVQHAMRELPARLENPAFAASVGAELVVRAVDAQAVLARLATVTDGRLEAIEASQGYEGWADDSAPQAEDPRV